MRTRVILATLAVCAVAWAQDAQVDIGKDWIGKPAGGVVLKDVDGNDVDLANEFGKRPVVLVLYRGVW